MLRGFLAQRALSLDEAQLLVEMLRTQYASDPNALWRLMPAVVGSTTDGKLIENIRSLAGTFVLVASSASDELTVLAAVNATSALRFSWGHKSRATVSRGALLNSASGLTLEGLVALYKTLQSNPTARDARLRATAVARVFEFIWVFDASVTDRLGTCQRMLEIASTIPPTGFSAIVNGLDKIMDDLDFTHSDSVSSIISSLGAKCVSLQLRQTPQKDLPVKHNSWESIVLRQLAGVLAKVSFPPLAGR